ncbi:NAD(P)H-hydrate dehydratase [Bacillus licheniformis]|nr:NAD(P)H-hydrate dehydratase [Bacillus licheniformis]
MLLGMLCCHENSREAVLNAVHLHGACADAWTKTRSAHALLAHELSDLLPTVWKAYEDGISETPGMPRTFHLKAYGLICRLRHLLDD